MKITVYSMNSFLSSIYNDDTVDGYQNSCFICIHSKNWVHSLPHFDRPHKNVLDMFFDDTDKDGTKTVKWFGGKEKTISTYKITLEQAKEILNFTENYKDIHIYCAKGKSRSTAVAKYLLDKNSEDSNHIKEFNHYVYEILKEADVQNKTT